MHKELRPHQIDLLIGNQSVNNEFSQNIEDDNIIETIFLDDY